MEKKKLDKKKIQLIIIGVMLVLLIAVVVIYLVLGNDSDSKEETTSKEKTDSDYLEEALGYIEAEDYENAYISLISGAKLSVSNIDIYENLITVCDKLSKDVEKENYEYEVLQLTSEDTSYSELRSSIYKDFINLYEKEKDSEAAYALYTIALAEIPDFDLKVDEPDYTPVVSDDGYVYFGSYPQNMCDEDTLPDFVKNYDYDENGDATILGRKYTKVETENGAKYFTYSPIAWMPIVEDDNNFILMTVDILDCHGMMDSSLTVSSWDTCDMKTWLNSVYFNRAINSEELKYVVKTHIAAPENYFYTTVNGTETEEYLQILSCSNLVYSEYGLRDEDKELRTAKASEYAIAKGAYNDNGYTKWWTSSNGSMNESYVFVNSNGAISAGGDLADNATIGVRPVMTVNK